ncbi:MAG: hypothetical protein S0880_29355 [Actinomycetota bacterium]|nr:hypothetical protein [Actinomycetota bacterium]
MSRPGRFAVAALAGLAWIVATAGAAAADPAGPTDYRSEVEELEPPTDAIEVSVLGGDSFLYVEVEPGTEVEIPGYDREPYLRISADGTVEENQRSRTYHLNQDRYGTNEDVPAGIDADAEPQWVEVDDDGSYAWHDHRAHWMQPGRPVGLEPGDTILDSRVIFVVEGTEVEAVVRSVWEEAPSPIPPIFGAAATVLVLLALARLLPAARAVAIGATVLGAAALVIGWWQFASLPPETAPSPTLWLLPATATIAGAVAIWAAGRPRRQPLALALTALAGAELLVWVWTRQEGLWRALIPTDAPFWLDRATTAAALVVGIAAVAVSLVRLVRMPRAVAPA